MILAKPGALQQVPVGMRGSRRPRHNSRTGAAPREDWLGRWGQGGGALTLHRPHKARTFTNRAQDSLQTWNHSCEPWEHIRQIQTETHPTKHLINTPILLKTTAVIKNKQKANLKNHHNPEELRAENRGEERPKDFPGGPVIRTPLQGVQVQSLVRELRSHKQRRQRSLRRHGLNISWDRTREKIIRADWSMIFN